MDVILVEQIALGGVYFMANITAIDLKVDSNLKKIKSRKLYQLYEKNISHNITVASSELKSF
jgi:hypothetical protein